MKEPICPELVMASILSGEKVTPVICIFWKGVQYTVDLEEGVDRMTHRDVSYTKDAIALPNGLTLLCKQGGKGEESTPPF